jgi:hypothetical protein
MDSFDSKMGVEDHLLDVDQTLMKASEGQQVEISPTAPFVPQKLDERALDISPTAPFVAEVEISPTMPFVPKEVPDNDVEISPTMPFAPSEVPDKNLEISPTMPFAPTEAPKAHSEISPTLAATVATGNGAVSATLPATQATFDMMSSNTLGQRTEEQEKVAKPPRVDVERRAVASPGRCVTRSATIVSEDSPSESQSDDEALEGEHGIKQNKEQRKREREWLRHNRRAARQQAKDATETAKRRKKKSADETSPILSTQERSRYEDLVDTGSALATKALPLLRRGHAMDEEDAFSGFGKLAGGIQKKKSFLMGK